MTTKGFFDVFTRYAPTLEKRKLLESAKDAKFRYVRYKRALAITALMVALSIIIPLLGKMGIEI